MLNWLQNDAKETEQTEQQWTDWKPYTSATEPRARRSM